MAGFFFADADPLPLAFAVGLELAFGFGFGVDAADPPVARGGSSSDNVSTDANTMADDKMLCKPIRDMTPLDLELQITACIYTWQLHDAQRTHEHQCTADRYHISIKLQ